MGAAGSAETRRPGRHAIPTSMGCRRHRDTRGKTNVICVFDPHVLSDARRFGSRERERVGASPLAGARGYPAKQCLKLLGDRSHRPSARRGVAASASEWCFQERPNITTRWYHPHILSDAGRFGSRERQRVVFPLASKYHDTLVSSPRPFERWTFSVAASASEGTHHHSLALAATRQIKVRSFWAINLTAPPPGEV